MPGRYKGCGYILHSLPVHPDLIWVGHTQAVLCTKLNVSNPSRIETHDLCGHRVQRYYVP